MKALGQAAGGPVAAPTIVRRADRLLDAVVRESPLVIALSATAVVHFGHLTKQFAADSWLNLLGGREIVAQGLPRHDSLAVLSHGHTWVDQQWLAHLFYYGAYALGGLSFAARANIAVFLLTVALVFWFARRQGAGGVSIALCSVPMLIVGMEFLRAQVLVEPLFVGLLALLAAESRRATKRVVLAFPLLALWANLHGSVVFGAALVAALGAVEAFSVRRAEGQHARGLVRPVMLIALPWACIVASPYGPSVLTYFRTTLRNPEFPRHLTEWASPTFASLGGSILFLSTALAIALVARRPRALTTFEVAALALTLAGAAAAVRSIPWFAIAFAMLLPRLLDRELFASHDDRGLTRSQRATIALAVAAAIVTVGIAFARPGPPVTSEWPTPAVAAVTSVLRADPQARVIAGYQLADWLLFESPEVRGRIAFDGRWEILRRAEFLAVIRYFGQTTPEWQRPSDGYRLVVVRPTTDRRLARWYEKQRGVTVLYRNPQVVVFDRGVRGDAVNGVRG